MSFYDLNTTKPILKSNGVTSLGSGGQPVNIRLSLGGILESLHLITQGTAAFTGTVARDINGPYNLYSNITLAPNQQVPIVQASGFGLALFNLMKYGLEIDDYYLFDISETAIANNTQVVDRTYINSGDRIGAVSGSQSALWSIPNIIPVTQNMINGIVGYWELGNPLAQLNLQLIPGYIGTASPYQMASQTPGNQPYYAASGVPATNNATLANPTVDVVRNLWDTPVDPNDRPPTTFINTIIEDTFQQNVGSASALKYAFAPLSGYVARVLAYVNDSSTGLGVSPTLMLNTNAFTFGIGDGTTLVSENIYENLLRQRKILGFGMPQGTFFLDFLGRDLSWQSVFSTYDNANVNLALNFSSAIGASSYGKVVRQVLKPLQYVKK